MTTPLLPTKLYCPPSRPNLVPRPQLAQRLNEGLVQGRKLTLVAAPAGFGKTTLVTEWLGQVDRPFAWLSLDEGDNDPVRFLTYLVSALQVVDDSVGPSVQSLLQSVQLPSTAPAFAHHIGRGWIEALMTALINDILAVATPLTLVLDDYHVIKRELCHEAMRFLVEHQPPNLHLVVVTREDPPLPLPRMRVRSQVTEIRERALRFTGKEATAFLERTMGLSLTAEAIATLEARTEGWIAGLQMAALSLQGRDAAHVADFIATFSGSHRYVIDFLAEEVLQRQPEDVRDFLCKTAILDRLSVPLCDAVTERKDSRGVLAELERANLFLIALDDRRGWYRYHHLFRDFLLTKLEQRHLASLHHRAAQWYEAHGLMAEAAEHALAAEDMDEAGRVLALASRDALQMGRLATVLGWMDTLPDAFVRANGELATFKGWAFCLTGHTEAAESYAASAEDSFSTAAPPAARGLLVTLRAYLAVQRGDNADALRLAKHALTLIEETDLLFYSAALLSLGHAQRGIGDTQAAVKAFRQAIRTAQGHRDHLATLGALEELTLLLHKLGQRREAAALCRQAIARCVDARGKLLPMAGLACIVLGAMCYEADDLEEAYQHVLKGLDLSQQLAMPTITLRGKITLARLQQAIGQGKAAFVTMKEARRIVAQVPFPRYASLVESVGAEIQLRQGDITPAVRWAEEARLSPADPPHPARESEYLTYARLLLAQNRLEDADILLSALERSAQEGERQGSLIAIRVLQALNQQALGRESEALIHLSEALDLAVPRDYRRTFLNEGPPVAELLPQVRHVAPDFTDRLLERFSAGAHRRLTPAQPLVEPLSRRELEVLRLVADGLSNREAAEALFITEGTVKKHLSHIFGKLDVKNRTQAVARAKELNLLA